MVSFVVWFSRAQRQQILILVANAGIRLSMVKPALPLKKEYTI